jgi:cell wall-associated NlpC family hydrolase
VLAALAALTLTLAPTTTASAEPSITELQTQAAALTAEVLELEKDAALATERYNSASSRLAALASRTLIATEQVDTAEQSDAATRAAATQRISAIYRAGNELALYATVLDGRSPTDVVTRLRTVQTLMDQDVSTVTEAAEATETARAAEEELRRLTAERLDLEAEVRAARDRVTELLTAREQSLSQANTALLDAVEAERRRLQNAEEEAARATLAAYGVPATIADTGESNPYAAKAIAAAMSQIGVPYVWGGTSPSGFDCSGLLQWAYAKAGLSIMRVAADQYRSGPEVPVNALAPGDFLTWSKNPANKPGIHHIAMYIGNGRMIEAPYTGARVRVVPIRLGPEFAGAVRPGGTARTARNA